MAHNGLFAAKPEGRPPVAAPAIALPKGSGTVSALVERLAANRVASTGSLTVPIAGLSGHASFDPPLAFFCDSSASNGPFDCGWNLPCRNDPQD